MLMKDLPSPLTEEVTSTTLSSGDGSMNCKLLRTSLKSSTIEEFLPGSTTSDVACRLLQISPSMGAVVSDASSSCDANLVLSKFLR